MPKRATIEDLRKSGYTVSLASGSVEVEEQALAEARAKASPSLVAHEAEEVGTAVAHVAVAQGITGSDLQAIVARATQRALDSLQLARDERVSFHERALTGAKEMPDVYFVSALGDPETPDDDVQLYVACKPDGTGWDKGQQEILNALAAEER
jgi:hypothetical protein